LKLLQNQSLEASPLLFLSFENFLEKLSGRSNVFIISKRHSSLNNQFYDRNQTLQAEEISDIGCIDLTVYFCIISSVINYICD